MQITVGIKGPGHSEYLHKALSVSFEKAAQLSLGKDQTISIPAKTSLLIHSEKNSLKIQGLNLPAAITEVKIVSQNSSGQFELKLYDYSNTQESHRANYSGNLVIKAQDHKVCVRLETNLEKYVQGVLRSEIPASYHIEAMKAQAILARTYGLRPRLDHTKDGYQVCDSYLCCQAFNGIDPGLSLSQQKAISDTKGQILSFEGKPALALFSACAGGHTEDYAYCFSDPQTNQFPAPAIPYLKGIAEGQLPQGYPDERALRALYKEIAAKTVDAWSPSFRWQVSLTADNIEAHMHHEITKLREDPQFRPFIEKPDSGKFGHVKSFVITERGTAGTGICLSINTSTGSWLIRKELTIRSVFNNPELKLKRLKSARIFFDHEYDELGLLSRLKIYGFGSGHGVGLQQTGAQGWALKGYSCEQILSHYYAGAGLSKID